MAISSTLSLLFAFFISCVFYSINYVQPATAFTVDLWASDAREEIVRLQQPSFSAGQNKDNDSEQLFVDVLLTPLKHWREGLFAVGNHSEHCRVLNTRLAEQAGNLTHCLLLNSRPFRACEKCVVYYSRYMTLYGEFLKDDMCHQMVLMADRMQFYSAAYSAFTSAWSYGFCNSCFDTIEVNSTTGHITYNYTAETQHLMELEAEVSSCFMNYSHEIHPGSNRSEVCYDCRQIYKDMDSNFTALKKKSKGKVCMDLVDMMNSTWMMWSTHFNCRLPPVKAFVVIAVSCVVGGITILLYVVSRVVIRIRMPQIFKAKRMKKCPRQRYGALSQRGLSPVLGGSSSLPSASAHVQGIEHHEEMSDNA